MESSLALFRYSAWGIAGGYRTVEGGADVESVYNFAWLHYAVGSVAYRY